MSLRASASPKTEEAKITTENLKTCFAEWLIDCELRQHTRKSIQCRGDVLKKFLWFIDRQGYESVGTPELKAFMLYLSNGHEEGRWGNPRLTESMRPVSVHRYYRDVKTLFTYAVAEGYLSVSPMDRIKPPIVRTDAKQPIPTEHLQNLLRAAKQSPHSRRDAAVLWLLLDTGLRAAEVCSLRIRDVDPQVRTLRVSGKGNKMRQVPYGATTAKALMSYLRTHDRKPDDYLFLSHKNKQLTVSGLAQIVRRVSKAANVPCPGLHSFRRTFAVSVLRSGGNVFAVQAMMGHSDLATTKRYIAIAKSDVLEQHRLHSPGDRLTL